MARNTASVQCSSLWPPCFYHGPFVGYSWCHLEYFRAGWTTASSLCAVPRAPVITEISVTVPIIWTTNTWKYCISPQMGFA